MPERDPVDVMPECERLGQQACVRTEARADAAPHDEGGFEKQHRRWRALHVLRGRLKPFVADGTPRFERIKAWESCPCSGRGTCFTRRGRDALVAVMGVATL